LGTGSPMTNSQCSLSPASAATSLSAGNFTVAIPLAFSRTYSGAMNVFVQAYDAYGRSSGWQALGAWTIPAPAPPAVGSLTPASGSGSAQTFAAIISDATGVSAIGYVYLLVNSAL